MMFGLVAAALLLPVSLLLADSHVFDHQVHVEDAGLACEHCHSAEAGGLPQRALMPEPGVCLDCHDEEILVALPEQPSSHAGDFEQLHQFSVRSGGDDCRLCHMESQTCTLCHAGENVDFLAHDRNWLYDHPLAARKGTTDCAACHDVRTECSDCHQQFDVRPGDHFPESTWRFPRHRDAAREDLITCLTCHDGPDPVCRVCHD